MHPSQKLLTHWDNQIIHLDSAGDRNLEVIDLHVEAVVAIIGGIARSRVDLHLALRGSQLVVRRVNTVPSC